MKTLVRARHLPGFAALALVLVLTGAELTKPAAAAEDLDRLLAPIALYPDQLLAQMLMCASDPAKVKELHAWLKKNPSLKGTPLQDAAVKAGFDPSYVALTLFPDIVNMMAVQVDWTTRLGKAFAADRAAVFDTIQRLRAQAQQAGTLKSTPQQEVQTQTTSSGQNVIVIEPTNPQVIYVPQYNPQTVYTTTNTVVVQQQSSTSSSDAAVAGLIGFTAGIAIGAAMDNDYYYGPYGWRGGAYMYNDAWDDYYDHREDAREDWQDHREDLADERGERAGNAQEQRTERRENQSQQSTDRQQTRQENRPESQTQRATNAQAATSGTRAQTASAGTQTASAGTRSSGSYESRGRSTSASSQSAARQRSGTSSDAFSGYSSGKSTRASSARGQSSRGGSRGGGGGRRR